MSERSKRDRDVHVVNVRGAIRWWLVRYRGDLLDAEGNVGTYEYPLAHSFRKQGDAVKAGRIAAKRLRCELVIHGRDGKIRRKVSYGHDSKTRKG